MMWYLNRLEKDPVQYGESIRYLHRNPKTAKLRELTLKEWQAALHSLKMQYKLKKNTEFDTWVRSIKRTYSKGINVQQVIESIVI